MKVKKVLKKQMIKKLTNISNVKKRNDKDFVIDSTDHLIKFECSINDSNGDARKHYNTKIDNVSSIWCEKMEHRLFPNICGKYVTIKCKNKFKCEHFQHGNVIKKIYGLKNFNDLDIDCKKKKKSRIVSLIIGEEIISQQPPT